MLDKTLPYFNVIMKRRADIPLPSSCLPSGFSFAWFAEGDEEKWTEIETAVGEFEDTQEALEYFQRMYLPHLAELKQRLLFVRSANGDAVGTICSWWNYTGQRRDPSVHWLAVRQAYQGLGLGRALVSECLNRLVLLEGPREVFLHTQTWSHKAIAVYLKSGFEMVQGEAFGGYKNDYHKAMPILRQTIPLL